MASWPLFNASAEWEDQRCHQNDKDAQDQRERHPDLDKVRNAVTAGSITIRLVWTPTGLMNAYEHPSIIAITNGVKST
jgi:hypothetical protein